MLGSESESKFQNCNTQHKSNSTFFNASLVIYNNEYKSWHKCGAGSQGNRQSRLRHREKDFDTQTRKSGLIF